MEFDNEKPLGDVNERRDAENKKPNAWRVNNGEPTDEDSLRTGLPGESDVKPVMEGQPMGGQNFGKNNVTPAGDDKNNPSRNAGDTNAYLARTEPSEEHPEDTNFKSPNQEGRPDYSKAQATSKTTNEMPKPEKAERGNGENDRPHKGNSYQEGTADNENEPNTPGPREVPDQQKVGEPDAGDDRDHIET
jgi:hypothetical protein